ncbi:MAG TPA: glycosyltransferase, partial [Hyphomicrobium sp.]|nr:glycosyltransferase [Hyphomicrobium sp.]
APRSYALARLQAEEWLKRYRQPIASFTRTGSLKLGILGYGSPLKPSTNIGDYVQTIALLGLMARSLPDDVMMHSGGADTFRMIADRVKKRAPASASAYDKVDAIWIDRDDTSTTPEGEKIWLPVNGWFMHPKAEDLYDFPFAENIRPIFVGMHINRPQMLTPTTVAYLKKYAPIGARDYHTAELLMANGVDAFFSGCPTLTLDNIFGRKTESGRSGQYFAAHKTSNNVGASRKQMIHSDPAMPTWSKDRGLATAWDYLTAYANAADVETTLLHCYLPCRAMNTPVTFTNAHAKTDTRFEGLIGITDQNRTAVAAKITANIDAVMDLILSGATEADVYKAWSARNAVGVAEIRARLEAKKPKLNIAANDAGHATQDFPKKSFKAGIEGPPPQAGQKCVDVVFCYDKNFDRATFVTLRSMLANTTSPLRVTLLTRGLEKDRIEAISRAFPQCEIVWLDVTKVKFKGLKLLRHTTESTMDRLFLPQFLDYTDRVLYLDVDIVVLGDIKDLYDLDLGDNALAARMTVFPGWASGYSLGQLIEKQLTQKQTELFRRQFVYGEPLGYGCFNAGVQLLDLKKLRRMNFTQRLLQIVDTYGVNDQFACNLFAAGNFARIPNEWNHFATQEWIDQPKLIHYTGYIKPWDLEYCPKAEYWRQYIEPADGLARVSATAKSWFK